MKRKHALAAISAASLGLLACALSRVAYPAPVILDDDVLAATRGGSSSSWCRANQAGCNGLLAMCDYSEFGCIGRQEGDLCSLTKTSYFNPEACDSTYGNETCSGNPPRINVLCRREFHCACGLVGGVMRCGTEVTDTIVCSYLYTENYCNHSLCPL